MIFDNITSNGTAKPTAGSLYFDKHLLTPVANTVATNKGSSTINEVSHLNSLRLKNASDYIVFKISGPCTIKFYTQSHDSRGVGLAASATTTYLTTQTSSTTTWEYTVDETEFAKYTNGVIYAMGNGGDFYIAGIEFTFDSGPVAVTGISLNKTSTTIRVGENETLTPTFIPINATNQSITWTSSNESVATVSDGTVTGVAVGNATITATTDDGGYKATCDVTVNPAPVEMYYAYLTATSGSPNVYGGTFKFYNSEGSAGSVPNGTNLGDYYYSKMNNDANYYELKLTDGAFEAGDEMTVYLYGNGSTQAYKVGSTAQTAVSESNAKSSVWPVEHTLTAAEIESDGTVRIYRNNSNTYFAGVKVEGNHALKIRTQPADQTNVEQNTTATFTVQANGGTTPYAYQWYSNKSKSNEDGTLISGATEASYSPSTATTGDFYFYCVVTDAASASVTSEAAKLNVISPLPKYTVTFSAGTGGTAKATVDEAAISSGDEVSQGKTVVFTATASTGYKFVNWTSGENQVSTDAEYTITSLAENVNIVANFEALPKITYGKGDAEGTAPAVEYCEANGKITLPQNFTLAKTGYTLTAWNDGTNDYAPGAEYTVTTDVTFTPVFTENTLTFGDIQTTVNWTFATESGAPTLKCENSTCYYVQRATIGIKTIDAIMFVDTRDNAGVDGKRGKLNNTSRTNCAQVNAGTVFEIPVFKGMTIQYTATNGSPAVGDITFNGENGTVNDKVTSYTYTGNETTMKIIDVVGSFYPSGITVTYPDNNKFATWTAKITKDATSALETASKESAIANIEESGMTDFALNGGLALISGTNKSNGNGSPKIVTTTTKIDADYLSVTFDVTDGYTFTPTIVNSTMVSVSTAKTYQIEITDGNETYTSAAQEMAATSGSNVESNYFVISTDKKFMGTVTLKVWVYGDDKGYRVKSLGIAGTTETAPSREVTINANAEKGTTTLYVDYPVIIADGTTAWYASSYDSSSDKLTMTQLTDYIPANTGVIIQGEVGQDYTFVKTCQIVDPVANNLLKGQVTPYTEETFTTDDGWYYLALSGNFKKYEGTATMIAYKAYLYLTERPWSASSKEMTIDWGEATGINEVSTSKINAEGIYNLNGVRVNESYKGIVISNGKKYINK